MVLWPGLGRREVRLHTSEEATVCSSHNCAVHCILFTAPCACTAPCVTEWETRQHCSSEVAGVTFSDSDSAPVPKFLNPGPARGPALLRIWESDSCSDSGYNHWTNRNLPMLLLKKRPHSPDTAEMEKWLQIRIRFFTSFWLRVRKENAESCRSRLQ